MPFPLRLDSDSLFWPLQRPYPPMWTPAFRMALLKGDRRTWIRGREKGKEKGLGDTIFGILIQITDNTLIYLPVTVHRNLALDSESFKYLFRCFILRFCIWKTYNQMHSSFQFLVSLNLFMNDSNLIMLGTIMFNQHKNVVIKICPLDFFWYLIVQYLIIPSRIGKNFSCNLKLRISLCALYVKTLTSWVYMHMYLLFLQLVMIVKVDDLYINFMGNSQTNKTYFDN